MVLSTASTIDPKKGSHAQAQQSPKQRSAYLAYLL